MSIPITILHSAFSDTSCRGRLVGIPQADDLAVISCNECGTVFGTIPSMDLPDEMGSTLDLLMARCRHCGAVTLRVGFNQLVAFVCDSCGKGNVVASL